MKYTHEIVGTHGGALLLEHAPGAKLLVCISLYGNLRKVPPFLMKSGIFLGFVFDIKRINFLE